MDAILIGFCIFGAATLGFFAGRDERSISRDEKDLMNRVSRLGHDLARLSRRIRRQRMTIRKMQETNPRPKRTREEWEAYRAAKTSTRPNLPH